MLALRDEPTGPAAGRPAESPGSQSSTRGERAIVCAACAGAITRPRHRIAVAGAHEHRFMNPAGCLFHIGCFAEAIGCVVLGPPSLEYPWFPGFAWRFALCAQCRQHLGWHFASDGGDRFFGLILNRLRQTGDPPRD